MKNEVSEIDLRMPEFRDPKLKLEDLEFDGSGQVVRKDRFERALRKISGALHGVNGLSARAGWTCDQVVEANRQVIDELQRLKDLVSIISGAPDDAEFYHFERNEYVKNIDQDAVRMVDKESDILIGFESRGGNDEDWCEDSAWIQLINSLVSIVDLKGEVALIVRSGGNQ